MFKKVFSALLISISFSGCQLVSKPFDVFEGMVNKGNCLDATQEIKGRFVSSGSGASLGKATQNAQAALAQQISSTISSVVEDKTRVKNGAVKEDAVTTMKLVSENVPIDQHRIDQSCSSGSVHYVQASLAKKALVKNSQVRLKQQQRDINQALQRAGKKSNYERYLIRGQLKQQLTKLTVFDVLLQQYAKKHSSQTTQAIADKAYAFIDKNSDLRIYIVSPKKLAKLLPPLENALRMAELNYGHKKKSNAAAEIKISGHPEYHSVNGRHITHLNASLEVRRIDTGELLASLHLGKKTGTSSVSRSKSLEMVLGKHAKNIKLKLNGDKAAIRKTLGII